MRTFPIKVHYKVIEILAVRWLGTKLMQIFTETTYYKRRKLARLSSGNDDEVSIILYWSKVLRTRLEYYTPLKRLYFAV